MRRASPTPSSAAISREALVTASPVDRASVMARVITEGLVSLRDRARDPRPWVSSRLAHHGWSPRKGVMIENLTGGGVPDVGQQRLHHRPIVQEGAKSRDPLICDDLFQGARELQFLVSSERVWRQIRGMGKKDFVAVCRRPGGECAKRFVVSS